MKILAIIAATSIYAFGMGMAVKQIRMAINAYTDAARISRPTLTDTQHTVFGLGCMIAGATAVYVIIIIQILSYEN